MDMRRKYRAWWTAIWAGSPPHPALDPDHSRPNMVGTPRQILRAVQEFHRSVGGPATMIGFVMIDPRTGERFDYRDLVREVREADIEVELRRRARR